MMLARPAVRTVAPRVIVFPRGPLPGAAALASAARPGPTTALAPQWHRLCRVLGKITGGAERAYTRGALLELWLRDPGRTRHVTGLATLLGHPALDVGAAELELPIGPTTLGAALAHVVALGARRALVLDPARPDAPLELVALGAADAELRVDTRGLGSGVQARLSLLGFRRPSDGAGVAARWIGLFTVAERQAAGEIARRTFTEALGTLSGRLVVRVALAPPADGVDKLQPCCI